MSESGSKNGGMKQLLSMFFGKTWPMWVGGILLGVGNICLFIVLKPWGASGGILNWGQNIFNSLGIVAFGSAEALLPAVSAHPYAVLCFLMLFGAFIAALMSKEFAFRIPPIGEVIKGLIGGVLMGIGAIIGKSCTIGGFFSGWPALSLGAIVFTVGLVIGTYISLRYLIFEMEKFPKISSGKSASFLSAATKRTSIQPLTGTIVLIIGLVIAYLSYHKSGNKIIISYVLIGLFFGFVCQRSRFCIVRALREPFMTGESSAPIGVMAGILVSMFGFVVIKFMASGSPKEMMWVWPHFWLPAIIGGVIFGLGMTLAGGCVVGSLWRAGEGHIKLWAALAGMIITMPLTAKYLAAPFYKALSPGMKQQIYLPSKIGYMPSILIFLLIILLWYLFVKWNERTGKFSAI
jgi:uncharacterized membrane protein YedE/YeeE